MAFSILRFNTENKHHTLENMIFKNQNDQQLNQSLN